MLRHFQDFPCAPARVVVLGAAGFVASATIRRLAQFCVPVLDLPRTKLELTDKDAGRLLGNLLRPDDLLVFAAARAPVTNEGMLISNLQMGAAVCAALRVSPVSQVVYISSDAVYADSIQPLTETSCAQPASLHGIMHLAREVMLCSAFSGRVCILRPTLIYGVGDPHNGYGPNRFCRLAVSGKDIVLFGQGEERRDHVWVEDVAELVFRVLMHQSTGILNVSTGTVCSFRKIAELAVNCAKQKSKIIFSPRSGPMPHNGYRPFDVKETYASFPNFKYSQLQTIIPHLTNI